MSGPWDARMRDSAQLTGVFEAAGFLVAPGMTCRCFRGLTRGLWESTKKACAREVFSENSSRRDVQGPKLSWVRTQKIQSYQLGVSDRMSQVVPVRGKRTGTRTNFW
jgi:hypothetical protein